MKETCGSCGYFVRHYFKEQGKYIDSGVGHCNFPHEILSAYGKCNCGGYTNSLPADEKKITVSCKNTEDSEDDFKYF